MLCPEMNWQPNDMRTSHIENESANIRIDPSLQLMPGLAGLTFRSSRRPRMCGHASTESMDVQEKLV